MSERLTKADWITHGLLTLATEGAGGLKVGPMAAGLTVSRGSFYWHFEDIAAFRAELLHTWRERATDRVIEELDGQPGTDRLNYLLTRAFGVERNLERALRAWAAEDADVAAVVTSVDASRVGYMAAMLAAAGVDAARAPHRAAFIYWAYLGQALVMDPRLASLDAAAIQDIAGVFER